MGTRPMHEEGNRSIPQSGPLPPSMFIFIREYVQRNRRRRMVGRIIPSSGGKNVQNYHYEVEEWLAGAWVRLRPSGATIPPLEDRRALEEAMRRAARLLGLSRANPDTTQSTYTRIPRRFLEEETH